MGAPWKKFGQKMKNLEIFFDIFDFHACLYKHIKFRQNRTKFGSVRASFSKTGRHGISIFTNFNHLRIIFESGYMRLLLSFFLPYVHLRLTVVYKYLFMKNSIIWDDISSWFSIIQNIDIQMFIEWVIHFNLHRQVVIKHCLANSTSSEK